MNSPDDTSLSGAEAAARQELDETLRLLAQAPAPPGLEERVHAALQRVAPRQSRVLAWPGALEPSSFVASSGWLRAAAAAAIVCVVAGGGWGVYLHVQHPVSRMLVIPEVRPATAPAGFSSAGAMRTPPTVKGPLVVQPAPAARKKARKKAAAKPAAQQPASPAVVQK